MGSRSGPLQVDQKSAGRRGLFLLFCLLTSAVLKRWSPCFADLLPSLSVSPPRARVALHAFQRGRKGGNRRKYDEDLVDDISLESIGMGKAYEQQDDKQADRNVRRQAARQARTDRSRKAKSDEDEPWNDPENRDYAHSPILDEKFRARGYFNRRDIGRLNVRELDSHGALQGLSVDELENRLERRFDVDPSDQHPKKRQGRAPLPWQQAPAAEEPENPKRPLRQAVRQRYSSDVSESERKQVQQEIREHREHFRAQKEIQEDPHTWGSFPPKFSGGDMKKIGGSRPLDGELEGGGLKALGYKLQDPLIAREYDAKLRDPLPGQQSDERWAAQKNADLPAIPQGSKMHKEKSFDSWLMPARIVQTPTKDVPVEDQEPEEKYNRIGNSAFNNMYRTVIRRPSRPLPWERVEFDNSWMQVSNKSWTDIGLGGDEGTLLIKHMKKFGLETPNVLQEKALPEIMDGKDVLISTNTGSGKTLAFVLPLLQKFVLPRADYERKRSRLPNHLQPKILCRPQVLFVVPSRELAQQIFTICEDLLEPFPSLSVTLLVGNYNHKRQDERLKNLRPAVVVGTPGKLMDHTMEGRLVLNGLNAVVLDEVDGLLSVSRQDHIKLLLQHIGGNEKTQRILASASGGSEESMEFIGDIFRGDYSVIGPRAGMILPSRVLHLVNGAPDEIKKIGLIMRLKDCEPEARSIMVFCNNGERARKVAETLKWHGMETDFLTGNRSKEARELAIRRFNKGDIQTLVATDAAMRGLDFRDLTHVVNFELPGSPVIYAHRAGRCGRMGYNGLVINLASGGAENKRLRKYADALGFELFEGNVRQGRLGVDEGRWYRPASHADGYADPYRDGNPRSVEVERKARG